jgi:hypothetical protein
MDTGDVRRRLQQARRQAKEQAAARRERTAAATEVWDTFARRVATPLVRQLGDALRAEGQGVTIATPADAVRLGLGQGGDFVELALDTSGATPQVVGRTHRAHGGETRADERPVRAGAGPADLSEDELLEFLLKALGPWLER